MLDYLFFTNNYLKLFIKKLENEEGIRILKNKYLKLKG